MTAEKLATMIIQALAAEQVMKLPNDFEAPAHVQRGYTTTGSVMVQVYFGAANERYNVTITKARG